MKQYLEIGMLNNTHGVRGEMKLTMWCDGIDYIKQFKTVYLDGSGSKPLTIASVRPQKNAAIVRFEEITSIEQAERLKGKIVYGNRDDAELPKGAAYIQDLIGCYVADADTKEEYGRVTDVSNYGSCDIYNVENEGKSILIPATPDIVKEINTDFGVIFIRPIKGLFDED